MKRTLEQVSAVLDAHEHPFADPLSWHLTALMEVGSGAHGTKLDPTDKHFIDDTDYLGIVVPPSKHVLGLREWTHANWTQDDMDIQLMSWGKFVRLLLKSNPNVLGCLWSQHSYLYDSWPFRLLVRQRSVFASKRVYASFSGYAYGQLKKMTHQAYAGYMGEKRKSLVDAYGYDCKNAAHAIRLFRMGTEFLRTGDFVIDRSAVDAEELKAIKSGKWKLYEIEDLVRKLDDEARVAFENCSLPDEPNYEAAEQMLLRGYDEWMNSSVTT